MARGIYSGQYRTFHFAKRNPVVEEILTLGRQERLKAQQIHEVAGISKSTWENWENGKTMQPRDNTLSAVSSALGYVRHDRLRRDGTLEIGYEKAKTIDFETAAEMTADWLMRHGSPNQKEEIKRKRERAKSKKTNGAH